MTLAPKPFTVRYKGEEIEFSPVNDGGRHIGYMYAHPASFTRPRDGRPCTFNWIDTESGKFHKLTRSTGPDGRETVTIRNSLLCPQGCGWHVMITDSVAKDA